MRGKFKNAGTHIILIIASFISVFPLYWMIAAATNNSTDVLGGKLSLGMNFMQNLTKLTEMQNVSRAFFNSLFYSTILSVLSLFICSIAGYGFEIYHDKEKDRLMNILLLAMMVPLSTRRFAPMAMRIAPTTRKRISLIRGVSSCSSVVAEVMADGIFLIWYTEIPM